MLNQEAEYLIVSANEAEPENGKISDESPVGEALLNRNEGDEVVVKLPNGAQVKFTLNALNLSEAEKGGEPLLRSFIAWMKSTVGRLL